MIALLLRHLEQLINLLCSLLKKLDRDLLIILLGIFLLFWYLFIFGANIVNVFLHFLKFFVKLFLFWHYVFAKWLIKAFWVLLDLSNPLNDFFLKYVYPSTQLYLNLLDSVNLLKCLLLLYLLLIIWLRSIGFLLH